MPSHSRTVTHTKLHRPPAQLRSPIKQESDYRVRRSKILRSLGQSTARNGSHFAVLWVSPTGEQTEVFASEALCQKLGEWLGRDQQQQARDCVRRSRDERTARTQAGMNVYEADKVFGPQGEVYDLGPAEAEILVDGDDEEDQEEELDVPSELPPSRSQTYDEFLPTPTRSKLAPNNLESPGLPPSRLIQSHPSLQLANQQPSPASSASSVPSPAAALSPYASTPSSAAPPRPSTPLVPWQFTPATLPAWYEGRISDLHHSAAKLVCKTWINTVEPQKRTNYPYQSGDNARPSWWPVSVRHKEPDHLTKPERIALLCHLVRFSPCPVEELEVAVDNMDKRQIADKLPVLQEVCRVAKEERKAILRCGGSTSPALYLDPTAGARDGAAFLTFRYFPDGVFDSFTVALNGIAPKQEDDAETGNAGEPRQHNTRHRARRSVGTADGLAPPPHRQAHQTPRSRAAPYPLSRSHSTNDMLPSTSSPPIRSPGLSASVGPSDSGGAGMTRSQSLAGPISSAGRPRNVRQSGRSSLGEADLLDPSSAKVPLHYQATPYSRPTVGGKAIVTPRQDQASPLRSSAPGLSRSYSTSALSSSTGPGVVGMTPAKKSLIDDSVASPAMIKSRSRLSQQHFDSMGLGNLKVSSTPPSIGKGCTGQRQPQPPHQPGMQHLPHQPVFHPHHLQQFEQTQLPHFPQGSHGGQPRPRIPSSHHAPHHQPQHQPHLVHLYPHGHSGSSGPPALVRSASAHAVPMHHGHSHQQQQVSHHHLPQIPHHPHAPSHGHHGKVPQHHRHPPTQVQVQVQVSAAHSLPPDFEQPHLPQAHSHSHPQAQHHAQHQQQAYNAYPTPRTATYASPHFASASAGANGSSPYVGHHSFESAQPSAQHGASHLSGHASNGSDALLHAQAGADSLFPGSAGGTTSPLGGMGEFLADPHSSGGTPNAFYSASPALGASASIADAGLGGAVGGEGDLTAYMRQLDALGAQQSQQQQQADAAGFDDASLAGLGLGMGMGGGFEGTTGGGMGMMNFEPGYYGGEDGGFGAVGA
ncbi:hypothetical protein JCM11641_007630 [Rhodosporidiobolus odoratus]